MNCRSERESRCSCYCWLPLRLAASLHRTAEHCCRHADREPHSAEAEKLIGFFVNTLVLRCDLGGNPSVHELLGRVRDVALGAYAHQDVPFEKVVEELQPERSLSSTPLFQVMLVMDNAAKIDWRLGDLAVIAEEIHNKSAKCDLTLTMRPGAGLEGDFAYRSDVFDGATWNR